MHPPQVDGHLIVVLSYCREMIGKYCEILSMSSGSTSINIVRAHVERMADDATINPTIKFPVSLETAQPSHTE